MKPDSTSIDLAVALAVFSSAKGVTCTGRTLCIGEVGLTGDLRSVQNVDRIVTEAARMGYEQIIMPEKNAAAVKKHGDFPGCDIIGVKNINDAMKAFGKSRR